MVGPLDPKILPKPPFGSQPSGPTRRTAIGLILGAPLLGACAGGAGSLFNSQAGPGGPAEQPAAVETGAGKGGLILPRSTRGNDGGAAQSGRDSAAVAVGAVQNAKIQLLIKLEWR